MECISGTTGKENEGFEILCDELAMDAALNEYWKYSKAKPSNHKASKKQSNVSKMFLKGPVPIHWLIQAAALGGKCLHIGVVLWLLVGLRRTDTFRLEYKWLTRFGVSRWAVYRNLEKLKQAGLVAIQQRAGCCPVITIINNGDGIGTCQQP